jgi:hypothetical protein
LFISKDCLVLTPATTVQNLALDVFSAYGYRRFIPEQISITGKSSRFEPNEAVCKVFVDSLSCLHPFPRIIRFNG